MPRRRAVILLNPRARSGASVPIGRLLEPFHEASWSVELWAGDGIDWTYSAALRAREMGVEAIFGAGGDGVLAQILPAILNTNIALGVVPLGTGNVWARELRLPLDPRVALKVRSRRFGPGKPRRLCEEIRGVGQPEMVAFERSRRD